jgi:DHA1 family tetracycline resistance protein-like MFS transporter
MSAARVETSGSRPDEAASRAALDPAASRAALDPAASRAALVVVFLTVFIDLLGFGIVLPVMPRQAEPFLNALGLSPAVQGAVIGVLFSSFSLMQFLFSPLWGRLSDRIGRRPMLLLSLAGSVVFYAVYAMAVLVPADPEPSRERAALALGLMLVSRIGAGIAGASVGTAAAVIADCTTPENRARGMALIGIAFGGGFTLGPLIAYFGLAIFRQQPWGVGAIASVLSLVALLIAATVFRETRPAQGVPERPRSGLGRMATVLSTPAVGTLVLVYFLSIVAFAGFESTLARLTRSAFGMNDNDNFLVFAFIGAMLLIAGGGYRPLAKRFPERRLLAAGVVLVLLGIGLLGVVAWWVYRDPAAGQAGAAKAIFYVAAAVAVAGFAAVNPSVSALISRQADPARQGEVLGVNQSFASLGRIVGPFLGSFLFGLHPSHALPFAASVALLLGVLALLPRIAGGAPR